MKGDPVELRLPDGPIRQAVITAFGLDGWMKDGYFYTASNPADPVLNLRLRDLSPDDLPAGTEVWLPQHPSGSRPAAGPCSYCQMMKHPEIVTPDAEVGRVLSSGGVADPEGTP